MKIYLDNLMTYLVVLLFIFTGCYDRKKVKTNIVPLTMGVEAEFNSNEVLLKLGLVSEGERILRFDEAMLILGCPYYGEDKSVFEQAPDLKEMKHSQVLVENEKHQFKVFSSGLLDDGSSITNDVL